MSRLPGASFVISEVISHYRILDRLDGAGLGELYLAEDTRLGRKVVLRLLPASYEYDSKRRADFIQQARTAAALRSPNIVLIYDIGEEGDYIFIVREYVEGEILAERLARGALEPREAVGVAAQIAEALDAAHTQGVLHRELKSSNVVIDNRGHAKVLDFGLSRIGDLSNKESGPNDQTAKLGRETIIDHASASVNHLAPEQALGREIDARSDIFSLGALFYKMLTGRLPFEGRNQTEIIDRILHSEAPSLKNINYSAPLELERIVSKCLEKEPERRYQSAAELLTDLRNLQRDSDSGAVEGKARKTSVMHAGSARRRASSKAITSLAVLPFANVTSDPDVEYLSDGITENIINNLSQLPKLRVMARSTVFRYKSNRAAARAEPPDPLLVGRELEVEAALAGRLVVRGNNLIISAELVDTADGAHLWGANYNRRLSDIFAIQEEIASDITHGLKLKLSGAEKKRLKKRHTESPGAYQLYLKGRYHWNKRTREGLERGIEYFKMAISEDSRYALAYAGLADCYTMLIWHNIAPPAGMLPRAKAAAERALTLDDQLAEAHASMGAVNEAEWDWVAAEGAFRRAVGLNPNYATAHQWYATYLSYLTRFSEAIEEMEKAQELDPLSSVINTELGWILYASRQIESAIDQYRATIGLDPDFALAHYRLAEAYKQLGRFDEAIEEIELAIKLSGRSTHMVARLGHAYAVAGRTREARSVLAEIIELSTRQYVSPFEIALIYVGLGENEEAFEWLERAYDDRSSWLAFLRIELVLDPLRDDPRFKDLLHRVNLPG
jgi:serine/threonine-protein kinase